MLSRLSIRYKIGFIALIGFIGFVVYQAASYRMSISIRDQLQQIRTDDFAILKFSNDIQVNFSELDKLYQSSLAEADMDLLIEADGRARRMKLDFETLRQTYNIEDLLFHELYSLFNSYIDKTSSHTVAVLGNAVDYERTLEGYAQIGLLRERYEDAQSRYLEDRYRAFENQLNKIEAEEAYMVQFGLVLGAILTLVLGVFSILIIRNLISAFGNAVNVAEQIASGNLTQQIQTVAQDETGQLMRSLHAMRDALTTQSEDNQQRESVQDFLGGLNETMRGDKTLDQLTHGVLEYLCRHFYAQIGAFYLLDSNHLEMVASYAYRIDDTHQTCFDIRDTLVGQVAVEKKPRIIDDVPDEYVQISSGLGQARPRTLMLVPILFEGGLKGLIEIAAFRRFSEDDLYLMRRCNDAIAISVNSAQSRLKVSLMLKQTQEQARELQNQREKLGDINRKLEERTKELDMQNSQLEDSRGELLEKSQALELSGKYKSQFLSTMSHELRTPLNSILILSESLKDNSHSNLGSDEVQHAEVIYTAGTELLTLINDILDLSKVEEGKMDIVLEPVRIRQLAQSLVPGAEIIARNKGLEYQVDVAPNVPETIFTDSQRVKQIVRNFISNAIKFTNVGGVYVGFAMPDDETRFRSKSLSLDNSFMVTVRDTGIGISRNVQERVFNAFEQADGTTSRRHGGTGLGLTISKELAILLGGEIQLHSDGENQGATFTLLVPLDARESVPKALIANVAPAENLPAVTIDSPTVRALLIEDNPVFHQVFKTVFKKAGFELAVAEDGARALALLQEREFDVLIVDLNLPDYSGTRLLSLIRRSSGYDKTPLFVFTAQDLEGSELEDVMMYTNEIIPKSPTSVTRVVDVIEQIRVTAPTLATPAEYLSVLDGCKILLVDDDERNLYSISAALQRYGCELVLAGSGVDAIEKLQKIPDIQIMLLDIMMPNMDGYEVLEKVRRGLKNTALPIVALTAKAMVGDREKCLKAGATGYLSKPVDTQELLQCIAQHLAEAEISIA
ncbi:Signal transduction histidine-protein kinase BarA [BD1-7 clade bacterium]|uniref:histidine kinase n=1 Tax=BD1-7 clade bacterium TaxID=2029982 RepID=A0A5S9QMN1_9GAMM|nr:Signal transduction histidine-protein kinase BarA [BD1-7 clade bacterium]CAA0119248.1 Signal transduction histidine-protein kinase BarA [BD1-7 clade bacterium]